MLFFMIRGTLPQENACGENEKLGRRKKYQLQTKSEAFNHKHHYAPFFFVSEIEEGLVTLGVISEDGGFEKKVPAYLAALGLKLEDTAISEVTLKDIKNLLRKAEKNCFIEDSCDTETRYGLGFNDSYSFGLEFGEEIIEAGNRNAVYKAAGSLLMKEDLTAELDRIYTPSDLKGILGHPVHYMFMNDNRDSRKEAYGLLLKALYSNGRLKSSRYSVVDIEADTSISQENTDALYKVSGGGAIVIRFQFNPSPEDDENASFSLENIEIISRSAKEYRNKVLTILCFPLECSHLSRMFKECLTGMRFVEIKEVPAFGKTAKDYIRRIAKEAGIKPGKALLDRISDGRSYIEDELRHIFDEWYDAELSSGIYTQYQNISAVKPAEIQAKPKGSAYDELQQMIGLSDAKAVINKAVSFYKLQKLYAQHGIDAERPAMHMLFTGNPGTAKTTAARLFARIMKDNGLLSRGHLVEVGRGDLVGKYVGWTAKAVQSKFMAAVGGVLFIDEAYSLVDDRGNSFGDEAINTIVQEMENHRQDLVVIFAGYPDKMEHFLDRNPGLRSRIAFNVQFADYSTAELCGIAGLIGKEKGIRFTEGAMERLACFFEAARTGADFGNGRCVRNVIEQSRMAQAERLVKSDLDRLTDDDIMTITEDDIVTPEVKKETKQVGIGFVA